jgi:hypothetical protein
MTATLPDGLKQAIDKALSDRRTEEEIIKAVDPRLAEGAKQYMEMLRNRAPPGASASSSSAMMPSSFDPYDPAGHYPPVVMPAQQAPPPAPVPTSSVVNASSMDTGAASALGAAASSLRNLVERGSEFSGEVLYKPDPKMDTYSSRSANVPHRRDYEICMVFPCKASEVETERERSMKEQMMTHEREAILKNLQTCGLHLHCFYSRDRDQIFCKVGAGADKLRDVAARMKYKLQLKPEYLSGYAEYRNDFPGTQENNFQDARMVQHIYKHFGHEDFPTEDSIFSMRDKIVLVHHIVSAKDKSCAGINVGKMMHLGELQGYFPLHEEGIVREFSGHWQQWLWMTPSFATDVRDYFGEKITLYYLFMAFYWKSWLLPAIVGFAMQLIDVLFKSPDNPTATFFCVFISVWSVLLPHFWKRQEAKFSVTWGTLNLVPQLETYRPSFKGELLINPLTNQVEPHYPWANRARWYALSLTIIATTSLLFMTFVLLGLVLRHMTKDVLPERIRSNRIIIFQMGFAIVVEVTNNVFSSIAAKLNDWENHRTQSEYDRHLLVKVMVFKFFNCYFILYYIAFLKQELQLLGMTCWRNNCFLDLQSQLASFVIVRLTLSNAMEYLAPRCVAFCRGFSEKRKAVISNLSSYNKLEMADMSSAETQAKREPYESFGDFDDVLIAHGYASFFAVTSPWVCAATLAWVLFETFIDVKGLCESRQRPLPQKVRDNEPWSTAFEFYGYMAALTNVTLLVFASTQYNYLKTAEKFFLWLYLLHIIILFKVVTLWLLPEMPEGVETLRLKQERRTHMALENIKLEAQQDYQLSRHQRSVNPQVYEQDFHDLDAEDPEPHEVFSAHYRAAKQGVMDKQSGLKWYVILIFIATAVLAVITAVALRFFGKLNE